MIWDVLEALRRRENAERGYVEVKTPLLYDVDTWVTSGHWEKFKDNMFLVPYGEERTLGMKPMNCPGHMLLFGNALRSYRELPLRYAEASALHRNERAGTLHGLLRVQQVTQDDAHIFVTPEQIEDEIFGALDFAAHLYGVFGMDARFELSTRPENKLGTDEEWDFTEGALRSALERRGIEYTINAGDGAFYGPKIDLHMTDVARPLLADGHDPARLPDAGPLRAHIRGRGQRRAHAVRHPPRALRVPRALHGHPDRALRRRVPGLARSGAGADHPRGVDHREAVAELAQRLGEFRVEVDDSDETVGKRIRNAEVEKIPYVVVWGDKESEDAIAVRTHGGDQSTKSLDELVAKLRDEAAVS